MVLTVGTSMNIEEDGHNEFKMHTRMSLSEIPSRCSASDRGRIVRTVQPASKTISAFLNTGGGNIYIGVDDEGVIKGLRMTRNMIDHFYLALHHCLRQFNPPVPPNLIKVHYEEVEDTEVNNKNYYYESDDEDDIFSDDGDITASRPISEWFMQEHLIGGRKSNNQIIPSADGTLYQNEEGLAYRRRNGSNKMLTIDEIRQFIDTEIIESSKHSYWSTITSYFKGYLY